MKIFSQSPLRPSQVLFAFDEVASHDVARVRWAVAYATLSGCERLVNRISAQIGQRHWERIEKQFVLSLDFGITEPDALKFLSELAKSEVRVAAPEVLGRPALVPQNAFHPKIYLFD